VRAEQHWQVCSQPETSPPATLKIPPEVARSAPIVLGFNQETDNALVHKIAAKQSHTCKAVTRNLFRWSVFSRSFRPFSSCPFPLSASLSSFEVAPQIQLKSSPNNKRIFGVFRVHETCLVAANVVLFQLNENEKLKNVVVLNVLYITT